MSTSNTPAEAGERLSPRAEALVRKLRSQQASDPRVAVDRRAAQTMIGCGSTYEIELENSGRLLAFLDGSQRRILVSSIYDYLVEKAIESYPAGGEPLKARRPVYRYRRRRQPPTAVDLTAAE
jgi:hypothetical protein